MNKDHAGGLFFLLVGVSVFSLSIQLPLGKLTEPGPALFPLSLSLLLSVAGILIFVSGKGKPKIDWRMDLGKMTKPLSIILLTLAFIIFMSRLGYLVTSFFYLFGLFFLVCRFRLLAAAGLSAILAAGSWYLFGNILGVHLPLGPWPL